MSAHLSTFIILLIFSSPGLSESLLPVGQWQGPCANRTAGTSIGVFSSERRTFESSPKNVLLITDSTYSEPNCKSSIETWRFRYQCKASVKMPSFRECQLDSAEVKKQNKWTTLSLDGLETAPPDVAVFSWKKKGEKSLSVISVVFEDSKLERSDHKPVTLRNFAP